MDTSAALQTAWWKRQKVIFSLQGAPMSRDAEQKADFWEKQQVLAPQRAYWSPWKPLVWGFTPPGDLGLRALQHSFGGSRITGERARGWRPGGTFWGSQGPSSNPGLGILTGSREKSQSDSCFLASFLLLEFFSARSGQTPTWWRKPPSTELQKWIFPWCCLWIKALKRTTCFCYPLQKRGIKIFYTEEFRTSLLKFSAAEIRALPIQLPVYTG